MKRFTLIISIFCMTVALSYAQGLVQFEKAKNVKANFAQSLMVDINQFKDAAKDLAPVWQCTFDEDIPSWTIGHAANTTKDWVIGDSTSRPCWWGPNNADGTGWWVFALEYIYEDLPEGSGSYAYLSVMGDRPTPLPTLPDGCTWTGTEPGITQYDAWIQFDNLDFSAISIPSLKFHNSYRGSNRTFLDCYFEYSFNDGLTWTHISINKEEECDDLGFNYGEYELGLPSLANQANVSIRFRHTLHGFSGDDYNLYPGLWAWSIDNVRIYDYADGPAHDLEVKDTRINFFEYGGDYNDPAMANYITYHVSSYYGQIPVAQFKADSTFLWFNISIKNNGAATITPKVNVKVFNPLNELFFDEIVTGSELSYSETDTLDMIEVDCNIENPIVGKYLITYNLYSENDTTQELNQDITPNNNVDTAYFYISENTFSREANDLTGSMTAANWGFGGDDGDGIGTTFLILYSDTIRSVDVFIDEETTANSMIQCDISEYVGGENPWSSVSQSDLLTIEEADRGTWLNIPFPNEYIIDLDFANGEKFRELLVGINLYYSGGDIYIGESLANNHSQISTRWKFTSGTNANQWIILSNYAGGPAIRLNYGTYSSIAQINVAEQISIYPNPTTGILNIEGIKGANVEVLNIMGQVVETIENTSEFNTIDMSRYSNGTYFVKVIVGNNVTTSKINLIK